MFNLKTDILKNQKELDKELFLPPKAHRIEKIEDVYNIPCAPNIFDDPSWVGNENRDAVKKFINFWESQGRSKVILDKLLSNTHFISKGRFHASIRSLMESIKLNCIKPVVLSVPYIPSISPFEMISTIEMMGLIEPSSGIYNSQELYDQWSASDFSNFFSQYRNGTFVGIDDIGLSGETMRFSTPLQHFSGSWSREYALVGASSEAVNNYFSSNYKLRCVHLSYRILSLDEILEPFELEELKTYYGIVDDDELHGYTTFRHNTVGDYFFRGLVKDRNFFGVDKGQGIIDFHNIRKLRRKELGLDK